MPRDIAVLFIHGIYVSNDKYHERTQTLLEAALPERLHRHINFDRVYWGDSVRGHQDDYLRRAVATGQFRASMLHHLVVQGLGDAAAYQKTRVYENSAYYRIQRKVRDAFKSMSGRAMGERPLVVIAHSLGCHIMSSYAWDLNKIKQTRDTTGLDKPTCNFVKWADDTTPLNRLDTFVGFVTMGSNMPLFTFTFGPPNVYPFTHSNDTAVLPAFPGAALAPPVLDKVRWLNFYSLNDPLGYPLRCLNPGYGKETRLHDIPVVSEGRLRKSLCHGIFRALSAEAAHTGYWTNRDVIKQTASYLQELIET